MTVVTPANILQSPDSVNNKYTEYIKLLHLVSVHSAVQGQTLPGGDEDLGVVEVLVQERGGEAGLSCEGLARGESRNVENNEI